MPVPIASIRCVLLIGLIWLLLAGLAAFELWPRVPGSVSGWLLFLALAPPLYLLAQGIAEWLWTTRAAKFVSGHPSRLVRITLGVLIGGVGSAVLAAIWIAAAQASNLESQPATYPGIDDAKAGTAWSVPVDGEHWVLATAHWVSR